MMKLAILLLTTFGCGVPPGDYSIRGIQVYGADDLGVLEVDVAYALKRTREELAIKVGGRYDMGATSRALRDNEGNLEIHFEQSAMCDGKSCGFECGKASPNGRCMGTESAGFVRVAIVPGRCVYRSALVHELIHMFNTLIENRSDPTHSYGLFFVNVCNVPDAESDWRVECLFKTVEYELELEMRDAECSNP